MKTLLEYINYNKVISDKLNKIKSFINSENDNQFKDIMINVINILYKDKDNKYIKYLSDFMYNLIYDENFKFYKKPDKFDETFKAISLGIPENKKNHIQISIYNLSKPILISFELNTNDGKFQITKYKTNLIDLLNQYSIPNYSKFLKGNIHDEKDKLAFPEFKNTLNEII